MNGILLVDKPEGWTSMDVCAKLRGALKERRIGHSGTLDPMATGLLVIFLGRATRAVEFAEADVKTYLAGMRLGLVTDTQDITGNVLQRSEVQASETELEGALQHFRGEIEQIPPMYSAIKIQGKKLYELARKGREVERKPRQITVFRLEQDGRAENGDVFMQICCSKGTYVRTLCHDIGAVLGCGAAMSSLRRTQAGCFTVDQAHTLLELLDAAENGRIDEYLLPVDTLFAEYPVCRLTSAQDKAIRNGAHYTCTMADSVYRLYSPNGEFAALAETKNGIMRPIKGFFEV